TDFEAALRATIEWYDSHESWWGPVKADIEAKYAGRGQ
ncbi:MAG: dTDP-glucose 4,6-dehydratase, partial [Mycobacterium sp.]